MHAKRERHSAHCRPRILLEKRMLLLIWNIISRFECVDFKRQKKERRDLSRTWEYLPSRDRRRPWCEKERDRERFFVFVFVMLPPATTRNSFVVFCFVVFERVSKEEEESLWRFFFNKRVESSRSVDSKRHDERRLAMCYDVRFINVLLVCKKSFILFRSLSLFCLFRLSR